VNEIVRQAARPESPNPMASMFSQTIQPYFSQALSRMFGMFGGLGQMPGTMPPQQGQPTHPGSAQEQATAFGNTGNQVSKQEMEDAFDGE